MICDSSLYALRLIENPLRSRLVPLMSHPLKELRKKRRTLVLPSISLRSSSELSTWFAHYLVG